MDTSRRNEDELVVGSKHGKEEGKGTDKGDEDKQHQQHQQLFLW